MKKQKLMAVVVLTALTGLFVGCNDDDAECIADYQGELTADETAFAGEWNLSAVVADQEVDLTDDDEENPSTDIFAQQSACEKDEQYVFDADRTFEYSKSNNAEDCDNPVKLTGTWKLGGSTLGMIYFCSENIVDLDFNSDRTTFSLTNDVIVTEVGGNRVETEVTFTYTKAPVAEPTE